MSQNSPTGAESKLSAENAANVAELAVRIRQILSFLEASLSPTLAAQTLHKTLTKLDLSHDPSPSSAIRQRDGQTPTAQGSVSITKSLARAIAPLSLPISAPSGSKSFMERLRSARDASSSLATGTLRVGLTTEPVLELDGDDTPTSHECQDPHPPASTSKTAMATPGAKATSSSGLSQDALIATMNATRDPFSLGTRSPVRTRRRTPPRYDPMKKPGQPDLPRAPPVASQPMKPDMWSVELTNTERLQILQEVTAGEDSDPDAMELEEEDTPEV